MLSLSPYYAKASLLADVVKEKVSSVLISLRPGEQQQ